MRTPVRIPTTDRRYELAYYEGLVIKTAAMIHAFVEEDFEDIKQVFRVKVWRALGTYDSERSSMPVDRYIFACVMNQKKDLLKRKKHNLLLLEDLYDQEDEGSRDRFARKHDLVDDHDRTFGRVEQEPLLMPSTLTSLERQIILRLYEGFTEHETARDLGLKRARVDGAIENVRRKLADWRPTTHKVRIAA